MPVLNVYSTNGVGRREILIPGRSPMRPFGAVQIINNVGQRQESDWAAIKAALGAGNVVICLSSYEADVLPLHIEGKVAYGGNVRFESKKALGWHLVDDGAYCHFEASAVQCVQCGQAFEPDERFTALFLLGGHMQREHREIAQRAVQAAS